MSRPAAQPETGAPYSGVHSPSMTAPRPLSLQINYPQTQRGIPSAHPTRASRAEVSSPDGQSERDGSMAANRRATLGTRPSPSRATTPQRRTTARRHRGIAASQPRVIHIPAPHHIPFRAPRRHRNHARAAQPPPITPSTSRAITRPTRSSITGSPALPIATQASHAVADAPTNPLFPPRVRHFAASPGSRAK